MTKIYLVCKHECDKNGVVKTSGKTIVDEVFTNRKLANAYVEKMNDNVWQKEQKWWWYWQKMEICKIDWSKSTELPY